MSNASEICQPSEEPRPPTISEMRSIDPRFGRLENKILRNGLGRSESNWPMAIREINRFLGFSASHPELARGDAYEIASDHFRKLFESGSRRSGRRSATRKRQGPDPGRNGRGAA